MEAAIGILSILVVACIALCAHFLQQIRDELREMNGKRGAQKSSAPGRYKV